MTPYQYIERPSAFNTVKSDSLPVYAVTTAQLEQGNIPKIGLNWAINVGFKATSGEVLLVPNENGQLHSALLGLGNNPSETPFISGKLARELPAGNWHLETAEVDKEKLEIGFGLGSYTFEKYKKSKKSNPTLTITNTDENDILRQLAGVFLARDLINIPTNDMGPDELEAAFCGLASHYDAKAMVIKGDELLQKNFPLIHTVGRASISEPRLLEMHWGQKGHPKLTLVGKGVCFDTGGLDIKPSSSMALMKKDMGGAANVLGLALMIMDANLPIDLRVLVPCVENSISSNAFRPGDIYTSRKGLTVQIDNTDAEGRLILADALAYADEEPADLMLDMATLTGAARVALGPDVPPFYTDDEDFASALYKASNHTNDPTWRLPLYAGYEKDISTRLADLTNAPSGGMAGSITAALFLKRFVTNTKSWAHFDVYGWSTSEKAHATVGGEAQVIRAIYHYLRHNFAK